MPRTHLAAALALAALAAGVGCASRARLTEAEARIDSLDRTLTRLIVYVAANAPHEDQNAEQPLPNP